MEPRFTRNGCEIFFCGLANGTDVNLFCNQSPRPLLNQNWDGHRLEYLLRRLSLRDMVAGRLAS
jgi:hypothetical protein